MTKEQETKPVPVSNEFMNVDQLVEQVNLIQEAMGRVMKKGTHYDSLPGYDKDVLLKPGAEKLTLMFRLAPTYEIEERDLSGGHKEFRIITTLNHINTSAYFGQGVGMASTMESKFRYYWENTGEIVPPEYWQSKDPSLLGGADRKPRPEIDRKTGKKTWYIYHKVERPPEDNYNTVIKMGKKRSLVDATLTATAASDIFTQDVEEIEENIKAQTGKESTGKSTPDKVPEKPEGGDELEKKAVEFEKEMLSLWNEPKKIIEFLKTESMVYREENYITSVDQIASMSELNALKGTFRKKYKNGKK